MQTPIDFGKEFLYRLFDQRDADACLKMLAGDLVWITPEDMHHFRSEEKVLRFLKKMIAAEKEPRYVDLASIMSSPSADNIMTVAYGVNLVSGEEEKPLYLRCSMVICPRQEQLRITFLHFSKISGRDSTEQLRDFVTNLPCGVMILACLDGKREEALYYNDYFARRLRYRQEEFAHAVRQNPFFMAAEEERERIHEEIAAARKSGGSISASLRFYRRDGNSFYYRMKGAPAYQANGGTVYYCVFQEITGFQQAADRLQERLDAAAETVRQVPEAICGIEYVRGSALLETIVNSAKDSAAKSAADSGGTDPENSPGADGGFTLKQKSITSDGSGEKTGGSGYPEADGDDVRIYRGKSRRKTEEKIRNKKNDRVFFTSRNIPVLFGVSNSTYMKNILEDPFYGLEITSITRARLLSSHIFDPAKTGTGEPVSCGIFRLLKPDGESLRVELVIRRVREKDGTIRLYLFYYDREVQQREMEDRIERAVKMGRAAQEQLRAELRRARENAARKLEELGKNLRETQDKYDAEMEHAKEEILEEKNRAVLISRQLEESKTVQKRMAEELEKTVEDASRRIRNYQSRADRLVEEARTDAEETVRKALKAAAGKIKEAEARAEKRIRKALQDSENRKKAAERAAAAEASLIAEVSPAAEAANAAEVPSAGETAAAAETAPAAVGRSGRFMTDKAGEAAVTAETSEKAVSEEGAADSILSILKEEAGPSEPGFVTAETASETVLPAEPAAADEESDPVLAEGSFAAARMTYGFRDAEKEITPEEQSILEEKRIRARENEKARERLHRLLKLTEALLQSRAEDTRTPGPGPEASGYTVPCGRATVAAVTDAFFDAAASGDCLLQEKTFSPEKCLDSVLIYEGMICEEKGISLRLYRGSRLPGQADGFGALLHRALCELVENAVSHTGRGGKISVHCRADHPSGGLVNLYFRIDDNGRGISEEEMQNLFEEKRAGDSGAPAQTGLFSAREAATLMGGSIHARSSRGGNRFSMTVTVRTV